MKATHAKPGPYYPMYAGDFTHGCRGLNAEQVGAYVLALNQQWELGGAIPSVASFHAYSGIPTRTAGRLLGELVTIGKLIETEAGFHNERMAREIAKFQDRSAAASSRERAKKGRKNARSLAVSTPVKSPNLSGKSSENSETATTAGALLRTQSLDSTPSPPLNAGADDEVRDQFETEFWPTYPDSEWKDRKADCLALFREIIAGASPHGRPTADELIAATQRYAEACMSRERKHGRALVTAPLRWLSTGRWLDYADRRAEREDALPWVDDADEIEAMAAGLRAYTPEQRLDALLPKGAQGWSGALGASPTSGERTALHDYIARTPGLLRRLERQYGTEFPSELQSLADMADDAPRATPRLQLAAVDGRAIA